MYYNPKTNAFEYIRDDYGASRNNPENPNDLRDPNAPENAFEDKEIRMGFIRKVYGILMAQLALTTSFICLFIFEPNVKQYSRNHKEIGWVSLAMFLILWLVLACWDNLRRSFPANIICLFLFTFFSSLLFGFVSSVNDTHIVLIATGISAGAFLLMTLFTCQTKIDFTLKHWIPLVFLFIMLCVGLAFIFIPKSYILSIIYAAVGAAFFCAFIIIHTQVIMGSKQRKLSPEEYIFAALSLYIDIIAIFNLALLGASSTS